MWSRVLPRVFAILSLTACDNREGDADALNAHATQGGGAGASQAGTGGSLNGGRDAGAEGGFPEACPACAGGRGVPKPPVVQFDPAVSAKYSWSECGRIAPGAPVAAGLYTPDESVLVLEEGGRILLYSAAEVLPTTLLPETEDGATGSLHLSPDGRRLFAHGGVYASADGAAIGADTAELTLVSMLAPAAAECSGDLVFSADSRLIATAGRAAACVWEAETGALSSEFTTEPGDQGVSAVALLGDPAESFVLVRHPELLRYSLAGELEDRFELPAAAPRSRLSAAAFTPDGQLLVVSYYPNDGGQVLPPVLVAIATETGSERWRQTLDGDTGFQLSSDGSVVVVHSGPAFRVTDGERVGSDPPGFFPAMPAVGPGGRRRLRGGEFLGDWDLESGTLLRLYGAHQGRIRDLDLSRDGRYLASHGARAAVWQIDADDFSRSLPLFNGAAADDSWNVALSADGQTMAVSGDNLAFFRRDGSQRVADAPPASAEIDCLSADWSFSPLGTWAAGTHYSGGVEIVDANSLDLHSVLPTSSCQSGVTFSADGSLLATARLELFETATWGRLSSPQPVLSEGISENAVQFSADAQQLVVTSCHSAARLECRSARYSSHDASLLGEAPGLSGRHARFSPEGHWLVSGGRVLHVPTGALVEYAIDASDAVFAPNGDIIAGANDGSLVRYCQSVN
jgi:WD40 repeat protein